MTLLWMDSFNERSFADDLAGFRRRIDSEQFIGDDNIGSSRPWGNGISDAYTISVGEGENGTQAAYFDAPGRYYARRYVLDPNSQPRVEISDRRFSFGDRFKMGSDGLPPGPGVPIASIELQHNDTTFLGRWRVVTGPSGGLLVWDTDPPDPHAITGESATVVNPGLYHELEWETVAVSSGTPHVNMFVYLDGSLLFNWTYTGELPYYAVVGLGSDVMDGSPSRPYSWCDHHYVIDNAQYILQDGHYTILAPNHLLGLTRVDLLFPYDNGTRLSWVPPTGVTNHASVVNSVLTHFQDTVYLYGGFSIPFPGDDYLLHDPLPDWTPSGGLVAAGMVWCCGRIENPVIVDSPTFQEFGTGGGFSTAIDFPMFPSDGTYGWASMMLPTDFFGQTYAADYNAAQIGMRHPAAQAGGGTRWIQCALEVLRNAVWSTVTPTDAQMIG